MHHPTTHAAGNPDKPAVIEAETGRVMTYAELDAASNRAAHLFRGHGVQHGDVVAFLVENVPEYYGLAWGAQRAGLLFVCISTKLTTAEVDYIIRDSGARLLVASAALAGVAREVGEGLPRFSLGGAIDGYAPYEDAVASLPATPIADERAGSDMLYSSGTTGRPKGIRTAPPADPDIGGGTSLMLISQGMFGMTPDTVYLCPAPLYHAAPLRYSMTVHRLGGTVVLMHHFDAEGALAAIERYRCTAGQFVPTHFIRMLKLPAEVRDRYDVSSLRTAIHAAAPCPVPVKRAMIDWWGPIVDEYYAGSEGNGLTLIKAGEWLERPGSVGRAAGPASVHVCDEDGNELPTRAEGLVYFHNPDNPEPFQYHNDPEKTAGARNVHGMTTLGDIGWKDEDGYLYLTDRKSFMIISGGVNIYPQEIENHLVAHPKVLDAAVVGGPHDEMGEEVIAFIQPADMADAGPALAEELRDYCRGALSGVKTPRRFEFMETLPRHDTGKLYKRVLRDQLWEGRAAV